MPITVIVGGQFGSEGKGKVAHYLARERRAAFAVRVGGPNSGHSVVGRDRTIRVFRQLPTAAIESHVHCVLAAGSYLDPDLLLAEVQSLGITPKRLSIDPHAFMISAADRVNELGLKERIGSTGSGTGAALVRRCARADGGLFARDDGRLAPFVRSVSPLLRGALDAGERIVLEGTQGFGLSVLHSPHYPRVTSRDTTAATFVGEAGLSPMDVDEIVLVIRSFPIRVAGDSGPLPSEIDWETVTAESGYPTPLLEHTSVTKRVRRVGRFDPDIVVQAIAANRPSAIVLNHLDYVDFQVRRSGQLTNAAREFVEDVERQLGRRVDFLGTSPATTLLRDVARPLTTTTH